MVPSSRGGPAAPAHPWCRLLYSGYVWVMLRADWLAVWATAHSERDCHPAWSSCPHGAGGLVEHTKLQWGGGGGTGTLKSTAAAVFNLPDTDTVDGNGGGGDGVRATRPPKRAKQSAAALPHPSWAWPEEASPAQFNCASGSPALASRLRDYERDSIARSPSSLVCATAIARRGRSAGRRRSAQARRPKPSRSPRVNIRTIAPQDHRPILTD
jgi:hypothetical protein